MRTFHLVLFWVGFALVASSSVPHEAAAKDKESFVAPADKALLVFVRPSGYGKPIKFAVVDDKGYAYARFKGKQRASAPIAPGKHKLYVIAENTDPIQIEVEAGRTYLILTKVRMGWGKARVTAEPIQRTHPEFASSVEWIHDTKPSTYMEGLQDWAKGNMPNIKARIGDADKAWAEQSDEWRASHTMGPKDGRTADEAGKI